MRTIALRFSDTFAPKTGTIREHNKIIGECGYVWYGKIGSKISPKIFDEILSNGPVKILMIKASSPDRYWATLEDVSYKEQKPHPKYYGIEASYMKTWLKITKIDEAPENILERCFIPSTGNRLSDIYKRSMGAHFNIEVKE